VKNKGLVILLIVAVLGSFFVGYAVRPMVAPVADPGEGPGEVTQWIMQSGYAAGHPTFVRLQAWVEDIKKATNGRLVITLHPVTALMPQAEQFTAVSGGTLQVSLGHGAWWIGTNRAFALSDAQASGLTSEEMQFWLLNHGGLQKIQELYAAYNIHWLPGVDFPAEMFLWSKKPIRVPADLRGVKVRAAGLALDVFRRLGKEAFFMPGGEIVPSLMQGVIDAAEFTQLYGDIALGFHEAAKYVNVGSRATAMTVGLEFNKTAWDKLPPDMQAIVTNVTLAHFMYNDGHHRLLEKEGLVLAREKGVTIVEVSPELNNLFRSTWDNINDEEAAKDPRFAAIWNSLKEFRTSYRELARTMWPWE
jgi:TRAP-type mannitol/chloroaromatic compound transport system substrate-binding protein